MNKDKIVHYGSNNLKTRTPCGLVKDLTIIHTNAINQVECIKCLEEALKNQEFKSRNTERWKSRLKFLKDWNEHLNRKMTNE